MNFIRKQSGFTLVEIAIVLVIISLLLVGVLKGQELINSARARNLAAQNSDIQAAYFGFVDRYRQVPGDMTPADACSAIGGSNLPATADCSGTPAVGGDGDGTIDTDSYGEAAALWAQLAASGFIKGSYTGIATNDADYLANTVAPMNVFNGRIMLVRTASYYDAGTPSVRLAYIYGGQIPVNILRELDVKVDDGNPRTGIMRHTSVTGGSTVFDSTGTCVDTTGVTWNIEANAQNCNAMYFYY
jgi:prepilin-type N-terminal cleavage/methylation domain-containing protein